MCGIAGFSVNPDDMIDRKKLSMHLLRQIQTRGRHATGAVWAPCPDPACQMRKVQMVKGPINADDFIAGKNLRKMTDCTRNVILHTRWATKGSPEHNDNNHPISVGKIIGVHNGHISNDDEIIEAIGHDRIAQVDSEAAMALIANATVHPGEVLGDLDGTAALAWMNRRSPNVLHLARVEHSPLAIAQTPRGSLIFASTVPLLTRALMAADVAVDWVEAVPEMTYLRIIDGRIHEHTMINPWTLAA